MRPADIEPRLRANPLFREVPTERLREFAQETTLRRFVEGETLWQAGDPATHLTLLVRGLVAHQLEGLRQPVEDAARRLEALAR